MIELLNLALPYFGLIFLGFACGRWQEIPERGLAWMDFFILYMALPVLFYRILAKTPLEQLNNAPFIVATTAATFLMLAVSFAIAFVIRRNLAEATIAALATGGKYYDVSKEEQLLQAYFDIDRQEKARFVSTTELKNVPHYAPFALAAFVLMFAAQMLRTRRYFTEIS